MPEKNLTELREDISRVTNQIVTSFVERQQISDEIAKAKADSGTQIDNYEREQKVIGDALERVDEAYKTDTAALVRTLITLSKTRQYAQTKTSEPLLPAPVQPPEGNVSYMGVPGAWSEHAAHLLFPERKLNQCSYFEDVFSAVVFGDSAFGVIPIENSRTGAIGETYDLLRRRKCYIVGQMRIAVRQCLLATAGATLDSVREVTSHPEGLSQCRKFLQQRGYGQWNAKNTAIAAQSVADRKDITLAAIGSRRAAEVYGLKVLAPDIMDDAGNSTRFIVIAAKPEYSDADNIISITFVLKHRAGSLVDALQAFALNGLNLTRIESRPEPGGAYRFFADIESNINDHNTIIALRAAASNCEAFTILGCYSETPETL